MDLITHLPLTTDKHDTIVVIVDRLSKMAHFTATVTTITTLQLATLFIESIIRLHGLPANIISDQDP